MARPVKYQHRREFQADDEIDRMVNEYRKGTKMSYAEAVRVMIASAADAQYGIRRNVTAVVLERVAT